MGKRLMGRDYGGTDEGKGLWGKGNRECSVGKGRGDVDGGRGLWGNG